MISNAQIFKERKKRNKKSKDANKGKENKQQISDW
jgi:hypothetical protein